MVGAAREEVVAPPPPTTDAIFIPATCAAAAILPRRILFHPPLKAPSPTSSSLGLAPLNLHPPPSLCSHPSDHSLSLHHKPSLPYARTNTLVRRIGAGLNNLGNTCFLNAVLQCLTYTPPLAAYFQAGLHQSSCRAVGFCAMCSLESHVKQALSAPGRMISPNQIVKNLRCISRSFQIGRQEDAHEYMRYLIEAMQKCCPLEAHANALSSSHRNFIQIIFGGRLQSQVKCTQCSHSSNTYDPFLDLSLDIVKAESLVKAFARFTAIDVLDGDNKYHCSKCKTKVRAHKQFTIDNAPHVLTVQFKRFSSSGGCGGKIDKKVQFDRTLNLTPFVNGGKEEGARYSLYAVLVHSGWSTHSGHYFCFVRTATDIWYKLDDSRVSQVSEKSVLEQKAYILFYVRDTEILQASNGNHHGARSDRFLMPHGTPNGAKAEANGSTIRADTPLLKGNLCRGSNHNDSAVRVQVSGFSSSITNHSGNSTPGTLNGVEVLVNEKMVRAPVSSLTKACKSAPAVVVGKERQCSTEVQANGVLSLSNNHSGNNDAILNKGEVQMNGDTIISPGKTCRLTTTEVIEQSDLRPSRFRVPESSCLTERKMKMNGILHHKINGNGSVKRVCLTKIVAKEHMPEKLERQAACSYDSASGVLSNKEKPGCDAKNVSSPMSSAALPSVKSHSFETAVPRWEDGEECKGSALKERNLPSETVAHCGHLLDEWDEEYDRGKRKKVRSRIVVQQGISEATEHFHNHKKRKKVCVMPQEHSSAALTSDEDCHGNLFQVVAGKKVQTGLDAVRSKKLRKRQRALGHKFFLKRHRFKQLHSNRQHKKKR